MAHLWCTLLNTFLVRVRLQTKGVCEEYKSPMVSTQPGECKPIPVWRQERWRMNHFQGQMTVSLTWIKIARRGNAPMTWVDYFIRRILIKQPQTFFKIFNGDLRDEVRGKYWEEDLFPCRGLGWRWLKVPFQVKLFFTKRLIAKTDSLWRVSFPGE